MINPQLLAVATFVSLAASAQAGLVAYWPFNDPAMLGKDAGASGAMLNTAGSAAFTANGKFGGGLSLNGSGSYLAGVVPGLPIGNSSYSQAAWFKPTSLGARGIVGWGSYGAARRVNALRLFDSGNGFRHYWWGADLDATGLPGSFTDGAWRHVATTYDGTTRRIYLNGAQVAQDTPGANAATAVNFRIGSTNNGEFFAGTLDEVAIYNSALTAAEVQSLASGGSPLHGPLITAFTCSKANAFEGETVQLAWNVNTSTVTGVFSYEIKNGETTLTTGTAATGSFDTIVPDLAGTAQTVAFTFRAIETGGNNVTNTATVSLAGDPGIPIATAQTGLTTPADTPLAITLAGSDPNGGTLSFSFTHPAHGSLRAGAGASRIYRPFPGVYGPDSFMFKVSDGKYESAPAVVRLTVLTPPRPPAAIVLDDTTISPANGPGDFLSMISSPDPNAGEAHMFALVNGPGSEQNANFTISGHQLRAAVAFATLEGVPQHIRIRSTDGAGLSIEQGFVLTVVQKTRRIVINEVHYNSQDNTVLNSFVELYNDTAGPVSLAGWRLSGGIDYRFPPDTTLGPGAYLVVAESPATMSSYFGATALGPWDNAITVYSDGSKETNGLANDGGIVRLRNASDQIVSEVDYSPRSPWPALGNGEGSSIELLNPALDESHGSNWASAKPAPTVTPKDIASPGAQNLRFVQNAAPAIRDVNHAPQIPAVGEAIVITAKITDPNGVASASLTYQVCLAGNFIPSTLPKAISGGNFVSVATPLAANPAFEDPANWTTLAMNDDGLGDDALGGDGTWTATIPPQPNRTLVRYRITVSDTLGASDRIPYLGDPSKNFACFVYNGVPAYQGTSAADLQTLPVYHFLTRKMDYDQCVAYAPVNRLIAGASWTFENWEACFVGNGVVHDHIMYRLHGGNGRYTASGTGGAGNAKRSFKFLFRKGYEFDARDEKGNPHPGRWATMITENCWENRATYTFSLNEAVNYYIYNQLGVPSPLGNWAHFRTVVQAAEQPDQWHGDFWGLMYVHEDYDRRFLDAHKLKKGNLYKLTRDGTSGLQQFRYQAAFGPTNGSDHNELHNSLRGSSTPAYITARVNLDLWCRYHAFAEAIRHYDYWPSGDNNAAMYFYPNYNAANNNKGVMWWLPYDVDATWGPTWNNGRDLVHNALFNDAGDAGGDAATNPTLWPNYFNQVHEIRQLLWQPDQINPLIDQFADVIRPFVNAEFTRWLGAPADAGNFGGLNTYGTVGKTALDNYVATMKDFAFDPNNNGSTWPGGNVTAGGRAAHLDRLGNNLGENATKYPATPVLSYLGPAGFPLNDLRFGATPFADPQGAETFAAIQWRIAQVNTSAIYDPPEPRLLEIVPSHDSGERTTFASEYTFPATACEPEKRYRSRVRMKDSTGRWSFWSNPIEFTAGTFDSAALAQALVVTEIMYHATGPGPAELGVAAALTPPQLWDDDSFDYLELRNVSANPVDLTGLQFTQGVDFVFPAGTILAPGSNILIVQNLDAFTTRYGSGRPVAGAWQATDKLGNGGDTLTLQFGRIAAPVISFSYDDDAADNWPAAPDGQGPSLVRIAPEDTTRDPSLGINWRSSQLSGGTPGGDDRQSFTAWLAAYGFTDPNADIDEDGFTHFAEYAMGGDPLHDSPTLVPVGRLENIAVQNQFGPFPILTFRRANTAEDLTQHVEFSIDLQSWQVDSVLLASTDNGDGTRTESWRANAPVVTGPFFGRVRFTRP